MRLSKHESGLLPRPTRVAVVGGGIAGLAAAHRLVEQASEQDLPVDVHLFEAGPRLGGTISTERTDGFVIEGGPDSFLSEKPAALRLCERLGATGRLIATRPDFGRTYVVHGGKLHQMPDGFLLLAPTRFWPLVASPLFSRRGKLRMALDLVLPRGESQADESLARFVTRRLGREALERVAQPLVGGIYTADPERLSLAATMPRFLEMEQRQRSIIRSMWRQQRASRTASPASGARWSLFVSFDDGMETLVSLIARRLPEDSIRLHTPVSTLGRAGKSGWRVNGEDFHAVVLATPAHASAPLLTGIDRELRAELEAIPYASSATVTLAFRREEIPHPLDGFGFVVPAVEKRSLIACTFSSLKYAGRAPTGLVLLRSFAGGALAPELYARDDADLLAAVRGELRELLGVSATPILSRVARHPNAMPQYHVGHLDRIGRIESRLRALPGLYLAGSAYYGVGIPDCIRGGERAADRILAARAAQLHRVAPALVPTGTLD
jgi:oxygen-dependent protoporphyrinogen oxidase